RERPLPADEHRERSTDEQEEQTCPEELLGNQLVVDGKDVLAPERRRRRMDRLCRLDERACCGAHGCTLHSQAQCASLSSGSYVRRASSAAAASQSRNASCASTLRTARIL